MRDRYAMKREFGHRVYLVGYRRESGEGEREGWLTERKREAAVISSEEGQGEREQRLEEAEDRFAPEEEHWVGGVCLLREQGNPLTGQIITLPFLS